MTTSALIMFLAANGIFTAFTAYYFLKVLRTAPPDEPEDEVNFPRGG